MPFTPPPLPEPGVQNWAAPLNAHLQAVADQVVQDAGTLEQVTAGGIGAIITQAGLDASLLADQPRQNATFGLFSSVKKFGAKGDGATNDTAAINAAIQATAGGTLVFPAGVYMIDTNYTGGAGLRLNLPNSHLLLDAGAKLQAITTGNDRYAVVTVTAADCSISRGTITGDVETHTGTTGEWGHCVDVKEAAHRFRISGTRVEKAWGDGICVGDSNEAYTTGARPADIKIENVVADSNRRQGLSLVAALRPQVIGGSYNNTGRIKFTGPGAGIAIEPNPTGLQNVTGAQVTDVICDNNMGRGLYLHAQGQATTASITNLRATRNQSDGVAIDSSVTAEFTGCQFIGNTGDGLISLATAPVSLTACTASGNSRFGFAVTTSDFTQAGCVSTNNLGSGYYYDSGALRAKLLACTSVGNGSGGAFTREFEMYSPGATLTACHADAGLNATKSSVGFDVKSGATGVRLIGCSATGTFLGAPYVGQADTFAMPKPGVARPAAITAPTAPSATYVQSEATAMKASIDSIRAALTALGITA